MAAPTTAQTVRELEKIAERTQERLDLLQQALVRFEGRLDVLQTDVREIFVLLARLDERVKMLEANSTGRSARTWAAWTLLASAFLSLGGGLLGAWLKNRFGIP